MDEWSYPPCRDLAFDFPRESAKEPVPLSDHEFDLLMHLVRYREDADLERVIQLDHPSDALLATLASEALQEDTTLYDEDYPFSPSSTPYPFAVINSILNHSRTLAHATALVTIYHHPGQSDYFLEILAGFCPSLTADVLLDAAQKVKRQPPQRNCLTEPVGRNPVLVLALSTLHRRMPVVLWERLSETSCQRTNSSGRMYGNVTVLQSLSLRVVITPTVRAWSRCSSRRGGRRT